MKKVLLSMLNSGLRISLIRIYPNSRNETWFFERPTVQFIDRANGGWRQQDMADNKAGQ
jgi:hypothetical protein